MLSLGELHSYKLSEETHRLKIIKGCPHFKWAGAHVNNNNRSTKWGNLDTPIYREKEREREERDNNWKSHSSVSRAQLKTMNSFEMFFAFYVAALPNSSC